MATIKFSLKPGECRVVAGARFCNRWKRNTAGATKDYEDGIRNPRRPWGQKTCQAQDSYKKGVDDAHRRGAFSRGVKKKGTRGWSIPTLLKGPTRFAQGVTRGGADYVSGYIKYHDVIKRTTLPRRFPKRDPRNIARCSAVCTALGRAKTGKTTAEKVTCPND